MHHPRPANAPHPSTRSTQGVSVGVDVGVVVGCMVGVEVGAEDSFTHLQSQFVPVQNASDRAFSLHLHGLGSHPPAGSDNGPIDGLADERIVGRDVVGDIDGDIDGCDVG